MQYYYERAELNSNLECPLHPDCYFPVNGVGGDGMAVVNSLLATLPSSHLFYGAACCHDVLYNLVSVGYVSILYPNEGITELRCKKDVDDLFLVEMLELANTRSWWIRWFFKHAARRNYLFVKKFGDSFFNHGHR